MHPSPMTQRIVNCELMFIARVLLFLHALRAIEAIARFVQPVLEGIFLRTGWPVSLFAGGPEPADGGRLNLVR